MKLRSSTFCRLTSLQSRRDVVSVIAQNHGTSVEALAAWPQNRRSCRLPGLGTKDYLEDQGT